MPEVGLELSSSPCKHWAPPEKCGNRGSSEAVPPSPLWNLLTLSTPQFGPRRSSVERLSELNSGLDKPVALVDTVDNPYTFLGSGMGAEYG